MTQDTRKDRRVKIVSLNVRYKSATVDEFIDNHAHDVSRGGIYIKTTNPFPPGTLLKFEIRLSSDQAVITGVGRVVWKRDSHNVSSEHPSGMGVKFIKVDEPSRALIDKLVNSRSDAGRAFESEMEAKPTAPQMKRIATPPAVHAATRVGSPSSPSVQSIQKRTMVGLGNSPALAGADAATGEGAAAGAAAAPGATTLPLMSATPRTTPVPPPDRPSGEAPSLTRASAPPVPPGGRTLAFGSTNPLVSPSGRPGPMPTTQRISTPPKNRIETPVPRSAFDVLSETPSMSRSPSVAPAVRSSSVPPRPAGAGSMFPKAASGAQANQPPTEPTMMKQAAELLEEALREAGGSPEDVGTNPLFSGTAGIPDLPGATATAAVASPDGTSAAKAAPVAADEPIADEKLADEKHVVSAPDDEPPSTEVAAPPSEGLSGAEANARALVKALSPGPVQVKARADAEPPPGAERALVRRISTLPPPLPATSMPPDTGKGGAGKWVVAVVVIAAGAAVFAFRGRIEHAVEPPVTVSAPAVPVPSAVPPPPPAVEVAPPPTASASTALAVAASASAPPAAASSAPASTGRPAAGSRPAAKPRPAPAAPAAAPAAPTSESTAASEPTTAPSATSAPVAKEPAPKAAETSTPGSDLTAIPTASPYASSTAAPANSAKARPARPSDDNPY